MFNPKSQAAMEQIMTYGWAILVVLIAIFALSYFGVFDVRDLFVPTQCTLAPGLSCTDFVIGENAVKIVLANSMGQDITVSDIDLGDCQGVPDGPSQLKNGQTGTFTVGLCTLPPKKYKTDVNITYIGETGLSRKVQGSLRGRGGSLGIVYDYLEGGGGFSGAVLTFTFNENAGITLTDGSGNGNDGVMSGGELVTNGGAETGDTTNFGFDGATSIDSNSGTYSFYEEGAKTVWSNQFIPVDLNKTYFLSGQFKSYGVDNSRLYFGYIPYDENQVRIAHDEIRSIAGTETTLVDVISPADKIVKVVDGTNWYNLYHAKMAFNVDDSGAYNDLPNRNISNRNITRVQNMGGFWEIEFNTNVGVAAPAGTKVRMHISGGTYMYEAASNSVIPFTWTEFSSTTVNENLFGSAAGKWWRGTRFARVLFLQNYNQPSILNRSRIDDISIIAAGPLWASGKYGSALSFGGVDDFISVSDSASLDTTVSAFSISAWIYDSDPDDGLDDDRDIVGKGDIGANADNTFVLKVSNDKLLTLRIGDGSSSDIITGNNPIPYQSWTHVAATFDGSEMNLYVDGILDAGPQTKTIGNLINSGDLVIGRQSANGCGPLYNNCWDGLIDSLAIYDRVLTPAEIAAHANS